MKLAIIGAGAMGEALIGGWLASGIGPDEIVIVEPSKARAAELEERLGVRAVELAVAGSAETVLLAVKPHQVAGVAAHLQPNLRPGSLVVSIAAGVPLAELEEFFPAAAVVRVMPNSPALVGEGMAGIVAGSRASTAQVSLVCTLLDAVGKSTVIDEYQIDALTALSGSGPAYLFYVAEAMIEAGVHQGLTRADAVELVNQTFVGSAKMLAESGASATVLRERVTSPAGTTAAALRALDEYGVRAGFLAAVDACKSRSEEMGKR